MTTEILICVLCRPAGADREAPRAGNALLEAVQDAALLDDLPFVIRPVECMNSCERACSVALQARGKLTYLFGGLVPDAACAADVLACAQLHADSADGLLARDTRPGLLRTGLVARLPALQP